MAEIHPRDYWLSSRIRQQRAHARVEHTEATMKGARRSGEGPKQPVRFASRRRKSFSIVALLQGVRAVFGKRPRVQLEPTQYMPRTGRESASPPNASRRGLSIGGRVRRATR